MTQRPDRIFVHRLKGSNSGHHHLMREEALALRAWLKVRGSFPGPIFLSKQKRPIDRTMLHLLMKKYGGAGIPEKLRHFHVLKHCCATHLLSKGFGVERVQNWIGHANIQSTLVRCSSGPLASSCTSRGSSVGRGSTSFSAT